MAAGASLFPYGRLVGDGSPHPLRNAGRLPAVLALHGFGGTPQEVELVMQAAAHNGLQAFAPLLPGHGTHARDLATTRYSDWYRAAEQALETLKQPLVVVGLSLGSLLAIELSVRYSGRIAGLVLLANACWLRAPFPRWALRLSRALSLPDIWLPKFGADIENTPARDSQLTYNVQPSRAAEEVLTAGDRAIQLLPSVHCPTLILHGALDRVCPCSNAWRAAVRMGTTDKRVLILPGSAHIITRDVDQDTALRAMKEFLSGLSASLP